MHQSPQLDHITDIPPFDFPEGALLEMPDLPAPQARLVRTPPKAKVLEEAVRKALRIVGAKTGETEMRLLEESKGKSVRYVVSNGTIAPYKTATEVLKVGKANMTKEQALAEFDRRVTQAYPPVVLRADMHVATHINHL